MSRAPLPEEVGDSKKASLGERTLLTCYRRPDRETLSAVIAEPSKVRDASV